MSGLREYEVQIAGLPHTLQLDDEGVKRYPGAKLVGEVVEGEVVETKQVTPANKGRKPAADKVADSK